MFEGTVDRFVKSVGRDIYQPVPSLASAAHCQPLGIVIKKNRRWLWQKKKYIPRDFTLNELLKDITDLGITVNTKPLVTYNRTSVFSMEGHIGAQLKSVLDVEMKGSDKVAINAKLGDVLRKEIDDQELLDKIKTRELNMKHPLLQQVVDDSRHVLCVVIGSAVTSQSSTLHVTVDWKVSDEEKVTIAQPVVNADVGGEMEDKVDKTFIIPKDTPLAYEIVEIMVTENGKMKLMVAPGTKGGFDVLDGVLPKMPETASPKSPSTGSCGLATELQSLIYLNDRTGFITALQNVLKKPTMIPALKKLVRIHSKANKPAKSENAKTDPFIQENYDTATTFLQYFGFKIKSGTFHAPNVPSPVLDSGSYLFDGLKELDDEVILALSQCDSKIGYALLSVLNQASSKKPEIVSSSVDKLYSAPNPGQTVLVILGFQKNGKKLIPPTHFSAVADVIACNIVAYCLWTVA